MGNVFFLDGFGEDPPGRRVLEGTDLEIAYRLEGDDLVLQVNKGPVQVFRVRLGDARKPMSDVQLGTYNAVAPDLRFMIGDSAARLAELAKEQEPDERQVALLKARLLGPDAPAPG